ncbi:hypothetical protein GLGCALEP_01905 [Pseudomonas sp. MM221]|nr:hypothetical protein GLGCALEP_01905 [Pseudomonas sp. MM221]
MWPRSPTTTRRLPAWVAPISRLWLALADSVEYSSAAAAWALSAHTPNANASTALAAHGQAPRLAGARSCSLMTAPLLCSFWWVNALQVLRIA